ncbi:MAG TPA: DUF2779 domain-containing protein, partial [Candidatus Cloacimonadota bacterium]|nr:DUF2779 domain-containing protein [Candidatus Cloacimonadota bacterium]
KMSELWDNRRKKWFFENDIYFLDQLEKTHLGKDDASALELSRVGRQWLQIEKVKNNDYTPYIEIEGLKSAMCHFNYPLHFIDFETCMVAIPFYLGQRPYEQIAFQFSHHVMNKNGEVEHKNEFIEFERGKFPNFDFVKALKIALENDGGTIFRYASHENTVLKQILKQIQETSKENLPEKDELTDFILSITDDADRTMIDMLMLVKKYYYHPKMKGSNSIKAVLPAIMESDYVRSKYSQPISVINISSKNYPDDMVWCRINEEGCVIDPYKLLGKVFDDLEIPEDDTDTETVADGGAAMTAFARMQFADMPENQRNAIIGSLKRYCELDTLAMVIIYDYFRNEIGL